MNYKITYHLLPWEIDYAMLSFTQFKKSKYHLTEDDTIEISACLNLSSYLIDWDNSKLPKQINSIKKTLEHDLSLKVFTE